MRLSGLVSHAQKEDVVVKASGLSRGDKSRNARLERLRQLVPVTNAIVGIDLADAKQMVVVTDHDSRVLARRTFRCRAWDLGVALPHIDRVPDAIWTRPVRQRSCDQSGETNRRPACCHLSSRGCLALSRPPRLACEPVGCGPSQPEHLREVRGPLCDHRP